MGIQWITFQGKQILSCSYEGIANEEEQLQLLKKQMKLIEEAPQPVLMLVNLEGAIMTPAGTQFTREHLSENNAKLKKIALVGIRGLKKVIVDGIGRSIGDNKQEMFDSLDEAKAWLVK